MLKSRVARVVDPFGNIVGIISASEKNKSVEARPSESALTVAFCRALAANDDREEVKGPDYLAEIFLVEEGKKSLKNPVAREWMIKRFAGTYEYFIARTAYFDEIVQRALRESVPQIVFLGAGYDTRAYRFGNLIKGTRIFELDTLATQQRKRQLLDQAKVAIPPQVDFVSINFERGSLAEALSKAGFDKNKTSVFIWEGVTYYLSPEAVDDTLAFVKSNSPAGSAICFDYVIQAPDISERYGVKQVFEAWRTTYSSERVQFGVDEGRIESFLSKRGFRMLEHLAPMQMEMKFLVLRDGSLAGRVLALFSMVHASVL
jgi:methyltransferase (TIGR00027 family)